MHCVASCHLDNHEHDSRVSNHLSFTCFSQGYVHAFPTFCPSLSLCLLASSSFPSYAMPTPYPLFPLPCTPQLYARRMCSLPQKLSRIITLTYLVRRRRVELVGTNNERDELLLCQLSCAPPPSPLPPPLAQPKSLEARSSLPMYIASFIVPST
jgi:hypothetical protein